MGKNEKNTKIDLKIKEENSKSFVQRMFNSVRSSVSNGAKLLFYGSFYFFNPMNWFKSLAECKHDLKQVYSNVVKGEEKIDYQSPTKISTQGQALGIKVTNEQKGLIQFELPRTLTGDLSKLTHDAIEKINNDGITISVKREKNEIVIEIDVKRIVDEVQSKNPEKNPEEIKELIIKQIEEKADFAIKEVAKACGGEFKKYEEQSLIKGVGRTLYQGYVSSLKEMKGEKKLDKSPIQDKTFSLTEPGQFPPSAVTEESCNYPSLLKNETIQNNKQKIIENEVNHYAQGLKGKMEGQGSCDVGTAITPSNTPSTLSVNSPTDMHKQGRE